MESDFLILTSKLLEINKNLGQSYWEGLSMRLCHFTNNEKVCEGYILMVSLFKVTLPQFQKLIISPKVFLQRRPDGVAQKCKRFPSLRDPEIKSRRIIQTKQLEQL